jgi:hypothetical protein
MIFVFGQIKQSRPEPKGYLVNDPSPTINKRPQVRVIVYESFLKQTQMTLGP